MLYFPRPRPPVYVIDAAALCRGIRAFCRSGASVTARADPAAALLDGWIREDGPAFTWVYSEQSLIIYEAVLCRLELSSRFVDRVTGAIRELGLKAAPLDAGDSPEAFELVFCAAAASVDEAAIVTPDPSRFPDAGRIRILSPTEALTEMSGHARYAAPAAGRSSLEPPGGPAVQGWPA